MYGDVYPLPPTPTTALPGTPEKVAVFEERASCRVQLFHPEDAAGRGKASDPCADRGRHGAGRDYRRLAVAVVRAADEPRSAGELAALVGVRRADNKFRDFLRALCRRGRLLKLPPGGRQGARALYRSP